ncbi:MAG: 16S rRNA (adenine(1518)-N(6)/adenine(1519)-N(6))-dimethyltransferase RsmA [Parcubacteria group bacterium]|jgi:16S rRNA (adenine1518-N6/adenine1519-N6)-dimethyltransferase
MPSKLGQNFLKNKDVVKRIVDSAGLNMEDFAVEVGPGKGILTEELAKVCKEVMAVEIDRDLISALRSKFEKNEKIKILEGDILGMNIEGIMSHKLRSKGYKVVANIPYYITSPLIRFFLENEFPPREMILMVQKEVAERITAKPGNHSILSLSVQYYANPELLFYVDKNNFDPVPEVDSAVIKILVDSQCLPINRKNADSFFRVVRAGFCAKRKTLNNNLSNSFHLSKKEAEEKLKTAGILGAARAQELDIEDWKKLARLFL